MEANIVPQFSEQLWREYRATLHRFILNHVNDSLLAEDLVQDVLTKAYRQLDTLKDQGKILPWLYKITRNVLVDYYRKHKFVEDLTEAHLIQEMNLDADMEKELAQCILPLVNQLPLLYRQAVMWAEIEGLTQKEVAQKQGLTLSGAKSRVQRGRKLLKNLLLKCCYVEADPYGGVINYQPHEECKGCS